MYIATKLILTTAIVACVCSVAAYVVSNDLGRDIMMLVILVLGIALIYGLKKNRGRVEVVASISLIVAATYLGTHSWDATAGFSVLTLNMLFGFMFSLAFFVAGYVVLLMHVSDFVDRQCGIAVVDDRKA